MRSPATIASGSAQRTDSLIAPTSRFPAVPFVPFLLALCLLGAPAARATGLAIVLNSGEATLSVIDMASRTELRRVPVLREPHHVALTPDGRDLLVGDSSGNELIALDPRSGEVRRRIPTANPYHLAFSPDGAWFIVTGLARNQVDIYDAATMQMVKRFPLRSMPSHIAYAPDSSMAFVTLQGTNRLAAFDLKRQTPLWNVEVGRTPAGVVWHGGKLLVANMGTDGIVAVDPVDGTVERKIKTGRGAHQIFPSPDGRLLYVNNRVDGTTTALGAATLEHVRTYSVPGGPDCMEITADVADSDRSVIVEQVANGVAVRMAALYLLLSGDTREPAATPALAYTGTHSTKESN